MDQRTWMMIFGVIILIIIIIFVWWIVTKNGDGNGNGNGDGNGNGTECPLTYSITGSQEVPPTTSGASGSGTATLNAAGTELSFSFSFSGLSGPFVAAHFHNAASGVNGPIVRTLTGDITGMLGSGVWRSTDGEPLTSALVTALRNGEIYINIHTNTYPNGEIRGQLIPQNC